MKRLTGGDLIRVDAAENQQMVVCRKVVERLDRRAKSLVLVQETENTDQDGVANSVGKRHLTAGREVQTAGGDVRCDHGGMALGTECLD